MDANRLVKLGELLASRKSEIAVIVYSVSKAGIEKNRLRSLDDLRDAIDKEEL